MQGRPQAAVDAATTALSETGWLNDCHELLAMISLVRGLGDLGRLDAVGGPAERGHELARTSLDAPMLRFILGLEHIDALHLGGLIGEANEAADRLAHEPMDLPLARSVKSLACGITNAARGDLAGARRWFREALATGAELESTWLPGMGQLWLATVIAKTGDHQAAVAAMAEQHCSACPRRPPHERMLAQAWVCAAGGVTSEAIVLVRCRSRACPRQRPGRGGGAVPADRRTAR